jgi:DNA-directed RNA polymerase subunit beta
MNILVISIILPDNEMPETETGERAEVILNPLGVINRTNPAQCIEQELNFISNNIVQKIKETGNKKLLFEYIKDVNSKQSKELKLYYNSLNQDERKEFWNSIYKDGIFLHQPPFWGNIEFDAFANLYEKYDFCRPLKFKNIEQPLILGELYFIRLKHDPTSKMSARSSSHLNLKNIPSKSTKFREGQHLYQRTPIRLGKFCLSL